MSSPQYSRVELDDSDRRLFLELVANGCSWRTAAKRLGLDPNAVVRAAAHDPFFRRELLQAEKALKQEALQAMMQAARDPRYPQAAAWLAERGYSTEVGRKWMPGPGLDPNMVDRLAKAFVAIAEELPPEGRKRVLAKLGAIFGRTRVADAVKRDLDATIDRVVTLCSLAAGYRADGLPVPRSCGR